MLAKVAMMSNVPATIAVFLFVSQVVNPVLPPLLDLVLIQ